MTAVHYRLKNHKDKLIDLFYYTIEKHDLNKIWFIKEITEEMNKLLSSQYKLTSNKVGKVIRIQKRYNPYRNAGVSLSYI